MRRILKIAVFTGIGLFAAMAAAGSQMSRVETPDYLVERADGSMEIRAYPALTVATTVVGGDRGSAVNEGFRTLANYIFGANIGEQKIEMTAPVMQSRRSPASESNDTTGDWAVRFVMPRQWSRESLPEPRDPRVTLESMPAAKFALIRFSGFWRDALLRRKTKELKAFIAREKLSIRGDPIFAFYNPPWTLPFFRRNEVMIEVREQ